MLIEFMSEFYERLSSWHLASTFSQSNLEALTMDMYSLTQLQAISHCGMSNGHCKQMSCSPLLKQKIRSGAQTYPLWPVVSINASDKLLDVISSEVHLSEGKRCYFTSQTAVCDSAAQGCCCCAFALSHSRLNPSKAGCAKHWCFGLRWIGAVLSFFFFF